MRQLNFRECVDGRSFMYTLNSTEIRPSLGEDHFFGVSRSCICQQCARGSVCLWEIERLCLQSNVEEFWRASVVDPGAKPLSTPAFSTRVTSCHVFHSRFFSRPGLREQFWGSLRCSPRLIVGWEGGRPLPIPFSWTPSASRSGRLRLFVFYRPLML